MHRQARTLNHADTPVRDANRTARGGRPFDPQELAAESTGLRTCGHRWVFTPLALEKNEGRSGAMDEKAPWWEVRWGETRPPQPLVSMSAAPRGAGGLARLPQPAAITERCI